jgi:proline iminopeptidase
MTELFPNIHPYATHHLAVTDLHTLFVEECGNPEGIPVVFLHGGPGAGCEPYHRRFFDPERYRIILFDQRGCGRSRPHAELEENTTAHLVADIERIREHLGITGWLVFGGSWGSTLALAYAEAWPERVRGLILRGVFLCREQEIRWFYQEGAGRIFPDYWQQFLAPIPLEERHDLLSAYHRRLTGTDELARLVAAKAWSVWEGRTATLLPDPDLVDHFADTHRALGMARIECHYFLNNAFLQPNQLLAEAGRIADIPGVIVQGRYDLICPMESAWELHQAWPTSELNIISDAGHAASEPGICKALVEAANRFAEMLA